MSTVAPQKVIASPQDLGNVAVLKDYDVSTVSQHDFYLLFGDHTLAPMFSMSHSLLVPTETSSALSAHSLPEAQQQTSTDSGGVAHCHNSTMSSTELCIGGAKEDTAGAKISSPTLHANDVSNDRDLEALFDSTLMFWTKSFASRATLEFFGSQSSADSGTDSSSSSSPNDCSKTTTSSAATSTPASSNHSRGKRKLVDSGSQGSDENDNSDDSNNNKRKKPQDQAVESARNKKLSCPFRKYSPTKYGLSNTRYTTCAMGSWKDISHLKWVYSHAESYHLH